MYNEFYGFRTKPFQLTPDPDFLYLSSVHKKALACLTYGVEDQNGFVVITGEIGAGKTTLLRSLMKSLKKDILLARINNTRVTSQQLLEMILQDFGLDYHNKTKTQALAVLNAFLVEQYSNKRHVVLVIDESQNLSVALLEEVRMLSNLETDKGKLLQIILLGQPKLREKLNRPELEQLKQRVTVNYHIPPLDRDELERYIKHRLSVAGPPDAVDFSGEAVDEIFHFSKGIPRLTNIACDAALLAGYVAEQKTITAEMVREVIKDMGQEGWLTSTPGRVDTPAVPADGQLLEHLERLAARVEQLEHKERKTKLNVRDTLLESGRDEPVTEDIEQEKARLNELRQRLEEEKHYIEVVGKKLEQKEAALKKKEALLEQERLKILAMAQDLTAREEAIAGRESSARRNGFCVAPELPALEVFVLEHNEQLRIDTVNSLDAAGFCVHGCDSFTGMLNGLRDVPGRNVYPVVILDAGEMEVSEGREGFREMMKTLNDEYQSVGRIVTSAYPYYSLRREAHMSGVDFVLAKPDNLMVDGPRSGIFFKQYIDELTICLNRLYSRPRLLLDEYLANCAGKAND